MKRALEVAFRTGGVAGMFTVGLGLLGATAIIAIFQNTSSAMLVGFGFGGSLLALFLRVGGGIFTKAADVGADLDLHFRTLIGTGANPNVAAVVVIGIEDGWTKRVVDGIKKTGKPVTGFGIELHGDHDTIMRASKVAKEYMQWASELQRVECPISDLWVSTKCGESDTTSGCGANPTVGNAFDKLYPHKVTLAFGETTELTGGEHLVAARCRTDAIRKKFQFMFDRYQAIIDKHKTSDLSDSQPTKGNIAGGLTTIEEALSNVPPDMITV